MTRTNRAWAQSAALLAWAIFSLVACESTPTWVKTGSYTGPQAKAFYSMGEVMGIRNEPLAWDAAENRARAQMVKILSTYTAYLMRDYAASTAATRSPGVRGYATAGVDALSSAATAAPNRIAAAPAPPGPPERSSAPASDSSHSCG